MYDAYYGFKEIPFRLSPDPSFFFGSKGHNRALAYLRYGLTQQEGFIVVTGTPGTGKTTIARALLQDMGSERIVVSELNTTHLQADDVLRMVAASYGLEHENSNKATLLKRLEAFFLAKYRAGYHCLLMIDEAQNLPFESIEELRMLSNFYQGNHALVQIFLLGQEQFRDMLYQPKFEQLRQRVVAATHLEPLSARDTRDYILHRLSKVGWNGENPSFTKRAFAHIYALTKGIPRRINTFCDRLLLFASLEELQEIDEHAVQQVARELTYEGTGRPGNEKDKVPETFTDSEADALFDDGEGNNSSEVTSEQKDKPVEKPKDSKPSQEMSPAVPVPREKPKPNLKLVSENGNAAREVEPLFVENQPEPKPQPKPKPAVGMESWVALLETIATAFNASDKAIINRLIDQEVPAEFGQVLEFANGQLNLPLMNGFESSVINSMRFEELRQAVAYYVKQVLLNNAASYYRRLGLSHTSGDEVIQTHYRLLVNLFRRDDGGSTNNNDDKRCIHKFEQAYAVLHDPKKRQAYDTFLEDLDLQANIDFSQQSAFVEDEAEIIVDRPEPLVAKEHETPQTSNSRSGLWMSLLIVGIIGAMAILYLFRPGFFGIQESDKFEGSIKTLMEPKPINREESSDTNAVSQPVTTAKESIASTAPKELKPVAPPVKPKVTPSAEKEKPVMQAKAKTVVKHDRPIEQPIEKVEVTKPVREHKVVPKPQSTVAKVKTEKKPAEKRVERNKQELAKSAEILTVSELQNHMQAFSVAYEEGKIDKFVTFFSKNAVTNDTQGIAAIRKDYETLFSSTEMRVIEITNLDWKITGLKASATGNFVVTILQKGSTNLRRITGTMDFVLSKLNGKIYIDEMLHKYGAQS